jgi:hypothetical protein
MRALIIAAGLCLATTAASAEVEYQLASRADANITLSNGCVYAPHPSGQAQSWSLLYTEVGTTARCALSVRTQAAPASQAPVARFERPSAATASTVSRGAVSQLLYAQAGVATEPKYLVGVFR